MAAFHNNAAFKAVLAESLARNGGAKALTRGAKLEGPQKSALEDVLVSSEEMSKLSYSRLKTLQSEVDRLVEREAKQVERMQFTLEKTKSDQAYYRSLQILLNPEGDKTAPTPNPACNLISPMEELLMAGLESSKQTHNRLLAIQAEIERALEREGKQVERLVFATKKARNDEAYYRSLRMMMEEGDE